MTECEYCAGELEYLKYTIRVGRSHPMHAFRCKVCNMLNYSLIAPKESSAVKLSNN